MRIRRIIVYFIICMLTTACTTLDTITEENGSAADDRAIEKRNAEQREYLVGTGDTLQVFVWRNPELSITVPVRPDGFISIPLVEDMLVLGKTPTKVARDVESALSAYIKDPMVSVIVTKFGGVTKQQVRVIGEATKPQAIPYRGNMTILDVVIEVGGLTEFAAGNRARLIRLLDGEIKSKRLRLDDLIKSGDITANENLMPGDIIIIPESWF